MFWQSRSYREIKKGINTLFPRLWRYCLLLTGSSDCAADLAQSTCLKALERSEQFVAGSELDKWLFRIAKNLWFNELRSRAVRQGGGIHCIDESDLVDEASAPINSVVSRDIINAIMALPEAQRIVVALVYVEGYSYKEASQLLDIPIGTVMSRLAVARRKLAVKYKPYKTSML